MAKHDLPREIGGLTTAGPSDRLDERIRDARDKALAHRPVDVPVFKGKAALFGLSGVAAGFGIGFAVAVGVVSDDVPQAQPEMQVHWVLSAGTQASAFDFSQSPEPMFGGIFDGGEPLVGDR